MPQISFIFFYYFINMAGPAYASILHLALDSSYGIAIFKISSGCNSTYASFFRHLVSIQKDFLILFELSPNPIQSFFMQTLWQTFSAFQISQSAFGQFIYVLLAGRTLFIKKFVPSPVLLQCIFQSFKFKRLYEIIHCSEFQGLVYDFELLGRRYKYYVHLNKTIAYFLQELQAIYFRHIDIKNHQIYVFRSK